MKTLFKKPKFIVLFFDLLLVIFAFCGKFIAELMIKNIPNCHFRRYGILCPSCGGTRAVYATFNGKFSEAFNYNQFFFLLAFYVVALIVFANLAYVFEIKGAQTVFKKFSDYKVIILLAVLWFVFGVLRNIF